jgi:hypothetical protein
VDAGTFSVLFKLIWVDRSPQVTGLVHDLGKLLFFFGSQGQWDVVGVGSYLSIGYNSHTHNPSGYFRCRVQVFKQNHFPGIFRKQS